MIVKYDSVLVPRFRTPRDQEQEKSSILQIRFLFITGHDVNKEHGKKFN